MQAGGGRCPSCLSDFSEGILSLNPTPEHTPPARIVDDPITDVNKPQKNPRQKQQQGKDGVSKHVHQKNQKLHSRQEREVAEARSYSSQEQEPWLSVIFDSQSRQAVVTFRGPVESLYTAGVFRLTMTFSEQHPLVPPVVKFMHQVFHPNVSLDGQVVDSVILKDLWSPALTLTTIICHIRDMLGSTSVALHGSPGPCDGPAGEVKGGLTRVLGRKEGGGGEGGGGGTGGRKKEEEEKEKEEEMPVVQVWVVGAECAGLWLTDPHTARLVTLQHTARCANHSLSWV